MTTVSTQWRERARKLAAFLPPVVLIAGVIALRSLVRQYQPQLHDANVKFSWSLLALASVLWLSSYVQLVQMWGRSLIWWESPPLPLFRSLYTFFLSNLARYIPGGVWQFAGLSTLATAEGTSPTAASMGLILMQIATLATGVAMTLSATPQLVARHAYGIGPIWQGVIAVVLIAVLIVGFPRMLPSVRAWAERRFKKPLLIPVPPTGAFTVYVMRAAVSWVFYAVAFWLFGRALLGQGAPAAWTSMTAYIASYMAGLLVVVAPGGLGVREAAIVFCLSPSIGREAAAILAISSRLWMVAMELGATGLVVAIEWVRRRRRGV